MPNLEAVQVQPSGIDSESINDNFVNAQNAGANVDDNNGDNNGSSLSRLFLDFADVSIAIF